jgi:hypothetical protein
MCYGFETGSSPRDLGCLEYPHPKWQGEGGLWGVRAEIFCKKDSYNVTVA